MHHLYKQLQQSYIQEHSNLLPRRLFNSLNFLILFLHIQGWWNKGLIYKSHSQEIQSNNTYILQIPKDQVLLRGKSRNKPYNQNWFKIIHSDNTACSTEILIKSIFLRIHIKNNYWLAKTWVRFICFNLVTGAVCI